VRNLYRFTKIYSGGEPELIDGDVFKTIVPLSLSFKKMNTSVNDNGNVNDKMDDNADCKKILAYLAEKDEISTATAAKVIDRSHSTARRVLLKLVEGGVVVPVGSNRNKKYKVAK
jgi:ATP-dependent DNA helicase RecG